MTNLHPHAIGPVTVETERILVDEIARLIEERITDHYASQVLDFAQLSQTCGKRMAYRAARAAGFYPEQRTSWLKPGRVSANRAVEIDSVALGIRVEDALEHLDPLALTLHLREAA